MNDSSRPRVVVWLDPTAPHEESLHVLAGLGEISEILGLFIEDMSLLKLSHLPVAREITFEEPLARQIDRQTVERQFRVHGARMKTLFETAAKNLGVSHSFRVTRGEPGAELLKVSTGCDMLVLSHSRRHFGPRLTIRARLGKLLEGGPPILVFVQEQWRTGQRVAVLFDECPKSETALRTAAAIASSEGLALSVWLRNVPGEDHRKLETRAAEVLGGSSNHSIRLLDINTADELVLAASAENPRVLVLPGKEPAETQQRVIELLDRVNCSLIVAR